MFSPPLKKSIVFLKYALKMDLVKGAWFDLYEMPDGVCMLSMTRKILEEGRKEGFDIGYLKGLMAAQSKE